MPNNSSDAHRNQRDRTVEALEPRRLLAAFGTLVPSYGEDQGETIVDFPSSTNFPHELITDSAGRAVTVSTSDVIRYRPDGSLDASFGNAGRVSLPNSDTGLDVAIDRQGNIYVLADKQSADHSTHQGLLYRYTSSGTLDTAWAAGDFTTVLNSQLAGQLAIQGDGKVVIAAATGEFAYSNTNVHTTVFRFNTDGTIDRGFGTGGRVELQLTTPDSKNKNSEDHVIDVSIVAGQRIVVIGRGQAINPAKSTHGDPQLVAVKLTAKGAFDQRFTDGSGFLRVPSFPADAAHVLPDGSFVVGGAEEPSRRPVVTYYEADGSVRWQASTEAQGALGYISDLTPLRDGRIVVAGAVLGNPIISTLSLTYVTPDGHFGEIVTPQPKNFGHGAGTARLATVGSALFVADSDARDLDSGPPWQQLMMKVDVGPADVRPGVFDTARSATTNGDTFAYIDSATGHVMFKRREAGSFWSDAQIVDPDVEARDVVLQGNFAGEDATLAYYDVTHGDLRVAHRETDDAPWQITTVDSHGTTGERPAWLATGSTLTYYDASKRALRFAQMDEQTGAWSTETIDAKAGAGRSAASTTVFRDQKSVFAVAYTDAAGDLNYAERRSAGVWEKQRLITSAPGKPGDIAFVDIAAAKDKALISFHDGHNGDLMVAYQSTHVNKWNFRTLASAGVEGLYSQIVSYSSNETQYVVSYNRSADRLTSYALDPNDLGGAVTRHVIATGFGADAVAVYGSRGEGIGDGVTIVGYDSELDALRVTEGFLRWAA